MCVRARVCVVTIPTFPLRCQRVYTSGLAMQHYFVLPNISKITILIQFLLKKKVSSSNLKGFLPLITCYVLIPKKQHQPVRSNMQLLRIDVVCRRIRQFKYICVLPRVFPKFYCVFSTHSQTSAHYRRLNDTGQLLVTINNSFYTVFNPKNCANNNKQSFVILQCLSYMFRPLKAILRKVIHKGIRFQPTLLKLPTCLKYKIIMSCQFSSVMQTHICDSTATFIMREISLCCLLMFMPRCSTLYPTRCVDND